MWISVKKRLPDELETVNIVFINHNPPNYYADRKDKPMTAMAIYSNGKWWWWSVECEEYLAKCGHCTCAEMNIDIEVTHWMPLHEPPTDKEGE